MPYIDAIQSVPATLQRYFRQPTGLSTLASLGVHGLLLTLLPVLPLASSNAEEPAIVDPVGVLELTASERSRLPNFSTPDSLVPVIPPSSAYPLPPNPYSTGLNQPPLSTFPISPRLPFPLITPTPLPRVQSRFPTPRNRSILPIPGAPPAICPIRRSLLPLLLRRPTLLRQFRPPKAQRAIVQMRPSLLCLQPLPVPPPLWIVRLS
ncbi:MAG: hypothetical protein HC881_23500 [Leptolyngbyaceae cyanobacterium SL_7_1]|nr:hypothetical protein [Leptolyngbyaceae cyanobacterium SL_7_1]